MELLQSLGVNHTVFYQLAIFLVVFFSVREIAFKPYAEAYDKRESSTVGSIDGVGTINKNIEELRHAYETEARELHEQISTIFDMCRGEAQKEAEKIVTLARHESTHLVKATKEKVSEELGKAIGKAKAEAPSVAQAMVKRLLA